MPVSRRWAQPESVDAPGEPTWTARHPAHDPQSRFVDWPGAANVRTLGALPTVDGTVTSGRVLRGEAPFLLDADAAAALVAAGVRHGIDLRADSEVAATGYGALQPWLDDGRVRVHRVRMALDPGRETDPAFDPYDDLGATYAQVLADSGPELARVLARVGAAVDADGGRVYVHCAAGKDRTGVVSALLADLAGVERAAIEDDYVATGRVLGPIVSRLSAIGMYRKDFVGVPAVRYTPHRSVIRSLLAHLDSAGGARRLLERHGLSDGQAEAVRALLRG